MPAVRWVGFGLVWLSLVVLSFDAIRNKRKAIVVIEQG
jgi:chloramphenicol-sensitive protein RarD